MKTIYSRISCLVSPTNLVFIGMIAISMSCNQQQDITPEMNEKRYQNNPDLMDKSRISSEPLPSPDDQVGTFGYNQVVRINDGLRNSGLSETAWKSRIEQLRTHLDSYPSDIAAQNELMTLLGYSSRNHYIATLNTAKSLEGQASGGTASSYDISPELGIEEPLAATSSTCATAYKACTGEVYGSYVIGMAGCWGLAAGLGWTGAGIGASLVCVAGAEIYVRSSAMSCRVEYQQCLRDEREG